MFYIFDIKYFTDVLYLPHLEHISSIQIIVYVCDCDRVVLLDHMYNPTSLPEFVRINHVFIFILLH